MRRTHRKHLVRLPRTVRIRAASLACIVWLAWMPGLAHALDLVTAVRTALAADARIAAARSQLDAAGERVLQARALDLPRLTANAQAGQSYLDLSDGDSARSDATLAFGAALTYPLYRPANAVLLEQSRMQGAVARLQLAQAEQDLTIRVANGYFDVLAALDTLRTVRAQNAAIAEQFESSSRRFAAGATTITDQQEAQARLDLGRATEVAAINELAVRRAVLARLTGQPVRELALLRPEASLSPPAPADPDAWTDAAERDNLAVRQAEIAAEIARLEIERARHGHRPTLDLVTSAQHGRGTSQTTIRDTSTAAGIALQLSLPIYSGGAIDARVREAIALGQRASHDTETARADARQLAQALFLTVSSGLERIRALETAERSSQVALESNLIGYRVGGRIGIDVLNAQQQRFAARRDLARARYDVLVASLALQAAAGRLDMDALESANALLGAVSR